MTHPVSRLDRILHALLWGLAIVFIPLALVVGVGRELLPLVSSQKPAIERLLSERTGLQIRLGQLSGDWRGLSPILRAEQVALHDARQPGAALLVVPAVTTEPDWWATLRDFSPRLRTTISGLRLTLAPRADGSIEIVEFAGLGKSDPVRARKALRWLLAQPGLALLDNQLRWQAGDRPLQTLHDVRLQQFHGRSDYRLQAEFRLDGSPSRQRALLVVAGDPLNWRQTSWQAYLQLHDLSAWQPWTSFLPQAWSTRLQSGSARVWLASPGGAPTSATVALQNVALDVRVPERGEQSLRGFSGVLAISGSSKAWRAGGDDLRGRVNGLLLPMQRLAAEHDGRRLQVSAARVSLSATRALVTQERLLPAALQKQLDAMQPSGWLPRLQVSAEQTAEGWRLLSANAEFKALTLLPTEHLPGVKDLAGWARGTPDGGLLYLDTRDAELDLHTIFREPTPVSVLRGGLRWLHRDGVWHVDSDVLQMTNGDGDARAQLAVRIPDGRPEEARLDLLASLRNGRVANAWRYVPWPSAGDRTLAWLQRALVGGRVDHGAFMYSGTMRGEGHTGRFDMQLHMQEATLDYVPGWPAVQQLNGMVQISGRALEVRAERARIMSANATQLRASIPDLRHAVLQIDADLAMDLTDLDRLLAESPLQRKTARVAQALELKGPAKARLGLRIPLATGHADVSVRADVQNAEVVLPEQRLTFSALSGSVGFDSRSGLVGSLKTSLWGRPAKLALRGDSRGGNWWRQHVEVDAEAEAGALGRWLETDLSAQLRGMTPVRVALDIPVASSGLSELRVSSTLAGMRLQLPEPFAKTAAEVMPLSYQGKIGAGEHLARATLGPDIQAGMGWRDGRLQRVLLRAGVPGVAWPEQPGFFVEARVPELDLNAWQSLLRASGNGGTARKPAAALPPLRQVQVQSERLLVGDQVFAMSRLRVQRNDELWQLRLSGLQPKAMAAWPATDVTATLTPVAGGWRAEPLELRQPQAVFAGSLAWQGNSRAQTQIKGSVEARDVGRILEQLGKAPFVTSESATAKVALQWPGNPDDFALDRLQGSIDARLKNGRIIEASGINLLTRTFGLLNASNIMRRLRFDFTDITRKGLNYDQLILQGELRDGVVRPASIDLEGPSVTVRGRGWVDLNTQRLEQQLRVGVPVSSAVPLVAGFLAGPVVGGALVAADLLLDKQLTRLTSVRYRVSGPWDGLKIDDEALEAAPAEERDKDKSGDKEKDATADKPAVTEKQETP